MFLRPSLEYVETVDLLISLFGVARVDALLNAMQYNNDGLLLPAGEKAYSIQTERLSPLNIWPLDGLCFMST